MSSQLRLDMAPAPKAKRTAALRSFVPKHENADEALAGEARAAGQETAILAWLRRYPLGTVTTPWDVAAALDLPITSARRALTMLTRRGLLVHDSRNRVPAGPYGQRSGTWRLAR